MGKREILAGVALLCLATAAHADDEIPPVHNGQTWTKHLLMRAKAANPRIVAIEAIGPKEPAGSVLYGTTGNNTETFPAAAEPELGVKKAHGQYVVAVPYVTSTGHRIGTLSITYRDGKGVRPAALQGDAARVAKSIAHDLLSSKNAGDPYPWDKNFGPNTYAQKLTNEIVARNPDILVVMLHATPPQGGPNVVIGSNIGRFGKVADEDDLRIINTAATNLEVAGEGDDRFETAMPMYDASHKQIGALGIVFHLTPGADKEAIHARGRKIRDELAKKIPNNAALFKPAK